MGKIKIIGRAEREYQPDLCFVVLNIHSRERTADTASKNTGNQCEKLLSELFDKGFELENMVITEDSVKPFRDYGYRESDDSSKESLYEAKREIRLTVPAEQRILNVIRDIIETGYNNISISKSYIISNESQLKKELLKAAVADSRSHAEYFAGLMGQKIIGIETANLSDEEDFEDWTEHECERGPGSKSYAGPSSRPLSDKLKAEPIKLESEVNIVWLIDNDDKTLKSGA